MVKSYFPKFVASLSAPVSCDKIKSHVKEMESLFIDSLPKNLFEPDSELTDHYNLNLDQFEKKLPYTTWTSPGNIPGGFSLVLICKGKRTSQIRHFFVEMVTKWLIPKRPASLLKMRSLEFHFEGSSEQKFFIIEVMIQIEYQKDISSILEHLPILSRQIQDGVRDPEYAYYIMESKGLSTNEKASEIQRKIVALREKFPKYFEDDIFTDISHFLIHVNQEFKKSHDVRHMCRIICSHYVFRKKLLLEVDAAPGKRHLKLKLIKTNLQYPFGRKRVIGIVICINLIKENEVFEEQHILKAISTLLHSITLIPGSFFTYESNGIRNVYIEIEKENGSEISNEQCKILRQQLTDELKASVEHLVNAVFVHHNEEEIYRNISLLSQELRFVNDIPQLVVSFQEQDRSTLTFLVIMVRLLRKNCPHIQALFKHDNDYVISPSFHKIVGYLRKKTPKEANVFRIQFSKKSFLRHDYAVDLYQARQYVIEIIESILGPVRDFNGGWLVKQLEVLTATKNLVASIEGLSKRDRLVEHFFYSLAPPVMRTLLSPDAIKDFFLMFYDLLDRKIPINERYLMSTAYHDNCFYLMIRSESDSFKQSLKDVVEQFHYEGNRLATVFLDVYGSSFAGYLIRHPQQNQMILFRESIEHAMQSWSENQRKHQMLRINIPKPISLDPRIGMDRTSGIIIKMLYEGLMRIGKDGKPELGVAEEYHISEDGCTYTFKLRNCQWTNGFPVIALDFEYAWKKILDPNFNNIRVYLFFPIKNAKAIKQGLCPIEKIGVKAVDSKTLTVELEHPTPYFLELVAHWAYSPLCRDIDRIHPGWSQHGSDRYVCNGPFKLAQWKDDRGLQVVKNHSYWDAKTVELEGINISVIENPQTAYHMFEQNQIDWLGEPLSELSEEAILYYQDHNKITEHPVAAIHWCQFNVERFPFNNRKMRQAFAYAINRKELLSEKILGNAKPALSAIPPMFLLQDEPYFSDGDTETARKLFYEALDELGISKEQLPPISLSYSSNECQEIIAQTIQRQWISTFGISIVLESINWKIYLEHSVKHNFQVRSALWYSWSSDPIYNLEHYKYRDDQMNPTLWEHPEYIKLLDASDRTTDSELRKKYLHQAEKLLLQEMPVIPIYYYSFRYAKKSYLRNVFISDIGQIDFKWASVAKR
ncbi:MAG: hypothetical protein Tsb0021_03950 [Chlamydiales bacterium]